MGWFHGYQQAYFWNHTTLAGSRFRSRLTGGDWLAMSIVNAFLVAFTLGIAAPWAYVRLHRMFFNGLSLEAIDLAKVHARASEGSGTGEAAAGMLDPDVGLDIGCRWGPPAPRCTRRAGSTGSRPNRATSTSRWAPRASR